MEYVSHALLLDRNRDIHNIIFFLWPPLSDFVCLSSNVIILLILFDNSA